jgi:hypothetical protein
MSDRERSGKSGNHGLLPFSECPTPENKSSLPSLAAEPPEFVRDGPSTDDAELVLLPTLALLLRTLSC